MNTLFPPSLGDSYQSYQKDKNVEAFVETPCQLKLPITTGEKGDVGILTDSMQALQLSERMNQMSTPTYGPNG